MMPRCSVEPVSLDPLAIAVIDWKKRRKRQRKKYQKDDPFVLRWPQKIEKHSPNNHTGHANCGEGLPKCSSRCHGRGLTFLQSRPATALPRSLSCFSLEASIGERLM